MNDFENGGINEVINIVLQSFETEKLRRNLTPEEFETVHGDAMTKLLNLKQKLSIRIPNTSNISSKSNHFPELFDIPLFMAIVNDVGMTIDINSYGLKLLDIKNEINIVNTPFYKFLISRYRGDFLSLLTQLTGKNYNKHKNYSMIIELEHVETPQILILTKLGENKFLVLLHPTSQNTIPIRQRDFYKWLSEQVSNSQIEILGNIVEKLEKNKTNQDILERLSYSKEIHENLLDYLQDDYEDEAGVTELNVIMSDFADTIKLLDHIELDWDYPELEFKVAIHPFMLRQVLLHLVYSIPNIKGSSLNLKIDVHQINPENYPSLTEDYIKIKLAISSNSKNIVSTQDMFESYDLSMINYIVESHEGVFHVDNSGEESICCSYEILLQIRNN